MADNLKQKATNSFLWNAFDKVGIQVISLIVGIITMRLLTPEDFGLIGALAIFTFLSNLLVESGFSSALIRRKNNTDSEYSAVFYFNLGLSLIFYFILYISAPLIAAYFRMPELCKLSRFLFISIILNSFGLVQNIILTKKFAFKVLTSANITSVILSGTIAIVLILSDFGYWALAWQQVSQYAFRSLMLWILSSWRLTKKPDFHVIKELFSFSIFLLANSIFSTVVKYIYNIIIGRLYTADILGHYSQAFKYQQIPGAIVSGTFVGVAYPVLAELNENPPRQLLYFRKIMRLVAFATFPIMIGLCIMAKPLFFIVLTEKWLPAVPYFQILIIAAITVPFHTLNINLITVKGKPKQMLVLEIVRNCLILLSLFFCFGNIEKMLFGFLAANFISYIIDLFYVRKIIQYKIKEQIIDILPYFVVSVMTGIVLYFIPFIGLNINYSTILQLVAGILFYMLILYVMKSEIIKDMTELFVTKKI